jgi:hypothetical protein
MMRDERVESGERRERERGEAGRWTINNHIYMLSTTTYTLLLLDIRIEVDRLALCLNKIER